MLFCSELPVPLEEENYISESIKRHASLLFPAGYPTATTSQFSLDPDLDVKFPSKTLTTDQEPLCFL